MKRTICMILLCALLASLTACGEASTPVDTTSPTTTDTQPAGEEGAFAYREKLEIEFPDKNYEGREFRVLAQDAYERDIYVESETGEVLNDTIYARNQWLTEQYNVKITAVFEACDKIPNTITNSVLAGEDAYDMISNHAIFSGSLAIQNVLMNMFDVETIDFSYPWWSESILDSFSYKNTALLAPAELCLSVSEATQCLFFNADKAADYQITGLYDEVRGGTWTIDKLISYTKDVYVDLDGSTTADDTDFYGLGSKGGHAMFYWYAFGEKFVEITDEGIEPVLYNEKVVSFFDKILSYYNEPGVHWFKGSGSAVPQFADGNRLFAIGGFDDVEKYLRDMESEFGILPLPKLDEAQEAYHTMAGGAHSVIGIPKTVSDPEFVGLMIENLNYYSYKYVTPTYCNTALKSKYARDDDSMEMIDLILSSVVFDFGYLLDNWKGFAFIPQNMVESGSSDLASNYASRITSAQEWWNSVVEAFEND
ncbi:MAG: hypothetical protein IJ493_01945 [Clostridia bacterium]|nr:hypothetical protein [Clostridia bacterium]